MVAIGSQQLFDAETMDSGQ